MILVIPVIPAIPLNPNSDWSGGDSNDSVDSGKSETIKSGDLMIPMIRANQIFLIIIKNDYIYIYI